MSENTAIASGLGEEEENGVVYGVYGDKNRLYLVLNFEIDQDLLPQTADFSVVYDKKEIDIRNIEFRFGDGRTSIEFILSGEISSSHTLIVSYKPTDWFMCDDETGDPVAAFLERFSVRPSETLALALLDSGDPAYHKASLIDAAPAIRWIDEKSLQLIIQAQLDIAIAPRINDFLVRQGELNFDVTEASYVRGEIGADIYLVLQSPLTIGGSVQVEYHSPSGHLKTIDSNGIADFVVEYIPSPAEPEPEPEQEREQEPNAQDVKPQSNSLNNSVEIDSVDETPSPLAVTSMPEVDDSSSLESMVEFTPDFSDVDSDVGDDFEGVDALFEQLEQEGLTYESSLTEDEQPDDQAQKKRKISEDSREQASEVEARGQASSTEVSSTELSSQKFSSQDHSPTVSTSPADPTDPIETVPAKKPMSFSTKLAYLIPICFFAWLLIVIGINMLSMSFDLSSGENKNNGKALTSSGVGSTATEDKPKVKREPCTLQSPDGGIYEGECRNGKRDGQGVFTWASGNKYTGEWAHGRQNGKGILVLSGGAIYDGEFRLGLEHGQGKMTWPNGAWYEGSYEKGKFNGRGIYVSADGSRYEGVFKNGSMTKNGTCLTKAGETYFGPCQPDKQ